MSVTTKHTFNAVGTGGQGTTEFTLPVALQLNNQDDLDVYVTKASAGIAANNNLRIKHFRQSTGSNLDANHKQIADTTGTYFPTLTHTGGTETLQNYQFNSDETKIIFNSVLATGDIVSIERRTRDEAGQYTTFAGGSTIRHTDLNRSSTESNYTAQEARNKGFDLENRLFHTNFTPDQDDTIDLGSSTKEWRNLYIDGTAYLDTVDIDAGAIDGTTIGANSASTGAFTTLSASSTTTINSTLDVNGSATVDNIQLNGNEIDTTSGNLTIDSAGGTVTVDDNLTVNGTVDLDNITGDAIVTSGTSTSDAKVYSAKHSDALFLRQDSSELIKSGDTWSADDTHVATTSAIDARVIDLVDEVGGFVPIANETSFPNANPDVNNEAGTIVSIGSLAGNLTSSSAGVISIMNGTVGNSTVTITGAANSTTYSAGYGMLLETTSTLNTYTFHRLSSKATEVTTVATNIADINTVAGNTSNINTVAGISSDVTTVAGKATQIGLLGTSDAIADMNLLGTAAIVEDMNLLGTSACVEDMSLLGTTACIADMATIADTSNLITNIGTVAGIQANVTTVAGISTDVTAVAADATDIGTCATNISAITAASTHATNAATSATNAATSATNAATSESNALSYRNSALAYRDSAAGILAQTDSIAYNLADNVSSHTAWGEITDAGNAVFANETANTLLTMSEGSSTYNYGSIT